MNQAETQRLATLYTRKLAALEALKKSLLYPRRSAGRFKPYLTTYQQSDPDAKAAKSLDD